MSVLYNPRAAMTDAQRRDADATIERRRRLNGVEAQERAEQTARTFARMDEMVQAIKVEIDPAPLVPDETWEARQARLNPLPEAKPDWFSVVEELEPAAPRVRIEDIQRVTARHFKVSRSDLTSTRRTVDIVRPRQLAMYLAKALTTRSLPEIGRRFGNRDHTTVLHAVRKMEALMPMDSALREDVEHLTKQLHGGN